MKYVNINSGETIGVATYNSLTDRAKSNYVLDIETPQPQVTHQIIETRSDNLSVGDAIVGVAVLPFAILGKLFG